MPNSCDVLYNEVQGWTINRGAIDGIIPSDKSLAVYDAKGIDKPMMAIVSNVTLSYSAIQFTNGNPDPEKQYKTQADQLSAKRRRTFSLTAGCHLQAY
ncbi:MAG: hypothetical protein WDO15_06270 [Bacteroidota bacterium]